MPYPIMLYLNYLFLIFEWSACKLAGQAKCSFHYKQAFNLLTFLTMIFFVRFQATKVIYISALSLSPAIIYFVPQDHSL